MSRSPSPKGSLILSFSPTQAQIELGPAMLLLFEKIRISDPQILEVSPQDFVRKNAGNCFGLYILNDDEIPQLCAAL